MSSLTLGSLERIFYLIRFHFIILILFNRTVKRNILSRIRLPWHVLAHPVISERRSSILVLLYYRKGRSRIGEAWGGSQMICQDWRSQALTVPASQNSEAPLYRIWHFPFWDDFLTISFYWWIFQQNAVVRSRSFLNVHFSTLFALLLESHRIKSNYICWHSFSYLFFRYTSIKLYWQHDSTWQSWHFLLLINSFHVHHHMVGAYLVNFI